MIIHMPCAKCDGERTYEVEVEGPDWDVGAGYQVSGELIPEESCDCEVDLDAEWDRVLERACEYPDEP